jgi:sulfate adenylyltransferase subunit 1
VIRPKTSEYHDFRGYAGKIYGADISVGDKVCVLPSLNESSITKIHFFDQEYESAEAGSSISIELADDINVTRGDMIVKATELPTIEKEIHAIVCWMDNKKLVAGAKYMLQHHSNRVLGKVENILNTIATDYSGKSPASELALNEIGEVVIKLSKAIYFDKYEEHKSNGSFILIDVATNTTAGVGFIQ